MAKKNSALHGCFYDEHEKLLLNAFLMPPMIFTGFKLRNFWLKAKSINKKIKPCRDCFQRLYGYCSNTLLSPYILDEAGTLSFKKYI